MIQRRVTVCCHLALFCVVMWLSENFPVRVPKFALMISTIKPAENDGLEGPHLILQIDHLLGRYCVK